MDEGEKGSRPEAEGLSGKRKGEGGQWDLHIYNEADRVGPTEIQVCPPSLTPFMALSVPGQIVYISWLDIIKES